MDNELLLFDRLNILKDTINKYESENFYISFSGGKDSTILHYLVDLAIPNNSIPRVFINTGIEYNAVVDFVKSLAENDKRFVILKPTQSIKKILEKYGYPFKSKEHSLKVGAFQNGSRAKSIMKYKSGIGNFACPHNLLYQFDSNFKIKLSDKCCYKLKKEPIRKWEKENNRKIGITGIRKEEGGQRANINSCITKKANRLVRFHPLLKVDDNFEDWFISKYNIRLCKLYYEPFNFKRTGCKGCPFALDLQNQLDIMGQQLPGERKQCEMIWKVIYDEYRRINYRLLQFNLLDNLKD